jgi:hypothetical protein
MGGGGEVPSSLPCFDFTVSTAAKMLESLETSSSMTSTLEVMLSIFSSSMASWPAAGERLPSR